MSGLVRMAKRFDRKAAPLLWSRLEGFEEKQEGAVDYCVVLIHTRFKPARGKE